MQNFEYYNPTRLIFGRGEIASLTRHIPEGVRVLVTFGGGSVKRNGVYDQVKAALAGIDHVEFWGIEANPKVETLRKCIEFGREQKAGFILAVGAAPCSTAPSSLPAPSPRAKRATPGTSSSPAVPPAAFPTRAS